MEQNTEEEKLECCCLMISLIDRNINLIFNTIIEYAITNRYKKCTYQVWVLYENDKVYPEYLARYILEDEEIQGAYRTGQTYPPTNLKISVLLRNPVAEHI